MPRNFFLVFFILCLDLSGFAAISLPQSPVKTKALKTVVPKKTVREDTVENIKVRQFDARKIEEYQASKDFSYDNVAPEHESLWSMFWRWFWRFFDSIFSGSTAGTYFGYLVIAVFVALVVFVLTKLSGMDFRVLSSKSKTLEVPYTESLDNIHEINFDQEIELAVSNGNYRFAIRVFYLRTLKFLSDTDQIIWQPEKTNQTYISEIADSDKRDRFKTLTSQFEFIWYGEFFLNKESFNELKDGFDTFNRKSS